MFEKETIKAFHMKFVTRLDGEQERAEFQPTGWGRGNRTPAQLTI